MVDSIEEKQTVKSDKPIFNNGRDAEGKFGAGNNIATAARGYAKPSRRLEVLLTTLTPEQINEKIASGKILNMPAIDAMTMHKIAKAMIGDNEATEFVFNRLEPKESGPSVKVNVNNAIANNQFTDVSETLEFIEGIARREEATPPKEPVQD